VQSYRRKNLYGTCPSVAPSPSLSTNKERARRRVSFCSEVKIVQITVHQRSGGRGGARIKGEGENKVAITQQKRARTDLMRKNSLAYVLPRIIINYVIQQKGKASSNIGIFVGMARSLPRVEHACILEHNSQMFD
jgi:hypothetical protein